MPHRHSLCVMASLVRGGEVSPVELVEAHLAQIERLNPELNAFVVVMADEARRQAREAEAALRRGDRLGPLHGIPVTVKDSFDVAGHPTLCGSKLRLGHRAARDATSVARLRAAGAIVIGKTNCPEFLGNYETDNYTTGRSNNPWDLKLLFSALAGYDSQAPFSAPVPLRSPDTANLKIGVMEQFYDVPVQPAICAAVRKVAEALQAMRIPSEPFRPSGLEGAPNLWW